MTVEDCSGPVSPTQLLSKVLHYWEKVPIVPESEISFHLDGLIDGHRSSVGVDPLSPLLNIEFPTGILTPFSTRTTVYWIAGRVCAEILHPDLRIEHLHEFSLLTYVHSIETNDTHYFYNQSELPEEYRYKSINEFFGLLSDSQKKIIAASILFALDSLSAERPFKGLRLDEDSFKEVALGFDSYWRSWLDPTTSCK